MHGLWRRMGRSTLTYVKPDIFDGAIDNLKELNRIGEELAKAFNPMMDTLENIARSFDQEWLNSLELPTFPMFVMWEREDGENLIQWGIRLERMGLLDKPDYRWKYQKACLLWMVSPVVWIWRNVRDR